MPRAIDIATLIRAIEGLPEPRPYNDPSVWYKTQKEHWLGWLGEYHTVGAYGRVVDKKRDARYAYNHIVNWQMLEWIVEAAGVDPALVAAAKREAGTGKSMMQKSAAIRRHIPWDMLRDELWPPEIKVGRRR